MGGCHCLFDRSHYIIEKFLKFESFKNIMVGMFTQIITILTMCYEGPWGPYNIHT